MQFRWIVLVAAIVCFASACSETSVVEMANEEAHVAAQAALPTETTAPPAGAPPATAIPPATAVPTAMPDPTAVPDVAAPPTPPAEPTDPAYGDIPTWEQIIADRPYEDPLAREARPEFDPITDAATTHRYTTNDDGQLVNGVFQREYPVGALTWTSELQIDVEARYWWMGSNGVAEPGDGGCFEILESDRVVYLRSTWEEDGPDFTPREDTPSVFDELDEYGEFLAETATYFERNGIEAERTTLSNGFVVSRAMLFDDDVRAAVEEFSEQRGGNNDYQVGRLEVIVDNSGQLFSSTIWARYVGEPRSSSQDDRRRFDSVYSHAFTERLEPGYHVRTPDQSLTQSGYCPAPTTELPGRWVWRSLIAGGSELTRGHLEQMDGAFVDITPDGTITGSTGCRSFAGTATIGFDRLENVDLTFEGDPCTPATFEEDRFEEMLILALTEDPRVSISLEEQLFLAVPIQDTAIIGHFGRE